MMLRALIFDVDGTLADTEETHRLAWNEAFEKHHLGWNWSKSRYAHLLTTAGGKERLRAHIDSLALPPAERQNLIERIPDIHQAEIESYTRMIEAGMVPLRDGVARLIEEAAQTGVRLAIASATNHRNLEALVRINMGEDALRGFDVIGTGEQVPRKKPAPDIYQWVLQRLDEPAESCVAMEDSFNGLSAARAAGLFTVVTPSYWTREEDFSAAQIVLPSLGSLGVDEIDRQLRNASRPLLETSREI